MRVAHALCLLVIPHAGRRVFQMGHASGNVSRQGKPKDNEPTARELCRQWLAECRRLMALKHALTAHSQAMRHYPEYFGWAGDLAIVESALCDLLQRLETE